MRVARFADTVGSVNPGDPFGLVGQVLDGQFRVDKFVGEGGFSIVYRGHHVGLDEPIAIKCLKLPAALGSALVESFIRRFRDESRLHYRLSQGNLSIARSIASGTTMAPATSALVPYMVLEWLEGRSMAQEFDVRRAEGKKGRTLEEVVRLLDPAAQAIAYAHAQGVVHRDLNPGNLFLATTREGQAMKVLDFGVAKIVSDHALEMGPRAQTIGQIRIFAPAYGAPEQFDDAMGKVGAQTDVYSLAMIALESLRDRPVREGEHLGEFALKALESDLPTPRRLGVAVGDEVEATFARAVALKVVDRPADVGEFWGLLKHAMQVDAASGRPPYASPLTPAEADRWKPMPPAAGNVPSRPITADMPAPIVEVTRPGSVAPTADTRPNAPNRPLNATVRMPGVPSGSGSFPVGTASGNAHQQSGSAALAGTPGMKSTLVMGNNPYTGARIHPSSPPATPPTTRTGEMPATPQPPAIGDYATTQPDASPYAHSHPAGYGAPPQGYGAPPPPPPAYGAPSQHSQQAQQGGYGAPPQLYGAPPPYGSPPQGQYENAYGAPSFGTADTSLDGQGRNDLPTIIPLKKSRGGLIALIVIGVVVLLGAAAFGAYRMMSARTGDAPASSASAAAAPAGTLPQPTALPNAPPAASTTTASAAVPIAPTAAEPEPSATATSPSPAAPAIAAPAIAAPAIANGPTRAPSGPTPLNVAPAATPTPAPTPIAVAPANPKAFNPVAAKAALDVVDGILASCRRSGGTAAGGKVGSGTINVTFANDGSVSHAVIDAPPFVGTPEADCVQSRFKHAHTTPFEGAPGEIVYTFHIPK